jgi:hypothetical protein
MLACWREINVSLKQNKNWAWLTRNVSFDSQVMLESHEILTLRQQLAESLAEKTTTTIQNLIQSVVQIPNFIDLSFESAHLSFFNVMLNWMNGSFIHCDAEFLPFAYCFILFTLQIGPSNTFVCDYRVHLWLILRVHFSNFVSFVLTSCRLDSSATLIGNRQSGSLSIYYVRIHFEQSCFYYLSKGYWTGPALPAKNKPKSFLFIGVLGI